MNFEEEILDLEKFDSEEDYIVKKGDVPILFSAPHTMMQVHDDGTLKYAEPFTKAIALYLNKYYNTSAFIKLKDNGVDSNRDNHDEYKSELIKFINENGIKLVIDLHGSKRKRNFDIEFGTLNNLTADFSTIKELEEAFIENKIFNISHNDPFKGGAITQYLYNLKDVDVIQLEINEKYRDFNDLDKIKQIIEALSKFIIQYMSVINK